MPLRILGTTNDSEFAGLRALGYSGAVNDMQLQYLIANGFTGSLSDMLYDFTLIPPFSLSISLSSIAEDASPGDSIGTLSASGGVGPYTYAIDTDTDAKFAIGGTGSDELVIRTGASLDYETATSHSVTIEITDTGDSNETYLRTLTIYVTNVIEAPVFTTSPALSPVSVLAGDTVTVTVAVATGGTATTALLANGVDVTGDIVAGDYTTPSGQDTSLTLYAVASNSDGVTEEYAYAEAYALPADTGNDLDYDIDPLTVPVNSAVPTISGTEQVGEDLTTTNGTWSPAASSYTYQWQVSNDGSTGWTNISGATASTFTLTASEESKYVRSGVAGVNAAGTGTMVYSAASGAIAAASGGSITSLGKLAVKDDTGAFDYSIDLTSLGLQDGDLVILYTGAPRNSNIDVGINTASSSGWTEETEQYADDTRDANGVLCYKFMGSTPDTSVSVLSTGTAAYPGVTAVRAFRGVDPTVFDGSPVYLSSTNTGNPFIDNITPTAAGSVQVNFCIGTDTTSVEVVTAPPSGWSDLIALGADGNSTPASQIASAIKTDWTSGTVSGGAYTGASTTANESRVGVTLSLKPA